MYLLLVIVLHAMVSSVAAFAIGPYAVDPAATRMTMWTLGLASAAISAVGLVATASYLSKRMRVASAITVGYLCGIVCSAILALAIAGIDFSLIVYLAILAPALLAIVLAVVLDRSKSGWQS